MNAFFSKCVVFFKMVIGSFELFFTTAEFYVFLNGAVCIYIFFNFDFLVLVELFLEKKLKYFSGLPYHTE